jgi:hypothetical protein
VPSGDRDFRLIDLKRVRFYNGSNFLTIYSRILYNDYNEKLNRKEKMKNKIKKYYEENEETIKYYAFGFVVGAIGVGVIFASESRQREPVFVTGRWADEAKTAIDIRVTQRNGKRKYTILPFSDLK